MSTPTCDSTTSNTHAVRLTPWSTWVPIAVLVLVLGSLYLDCRTAAGQVAIKLLDGTLVHSDAQQQRRSSTPAQQLVTNTSSTRSSGVEQQQEQEPGEEEDYSVSADSSPDAEAPRPSNATTAAAAVPPTPAPPCNNTAPSQPSPAPARPAFPRVVPDLSTHKDPVPRVVPDLSTHKDPVLPAVARTVLESDRQGVGRRIISFSLFGSEARYVEGAIDNAVLARHFWPGWTMRIYYGDGVPQQVLEIVRALGVELVRVDDPQERAASTFWRYYVATDPTVSRFIARDIDARLSHRDKAAVEEWISTGLFFHTMHDHMAHVLNIMGGLWGAVGGFVNPQYMQAAIKNATGHAWGIDQDWLGAELFPHVQNYTLDHSSYNCGDFHVADNRGFPTPRADDHDLVGNVHAPPDYKGITHNGPCPERCRRDASWINC